MLSMRLVICFIGMSNLFRKSGLIESFHQLRTANIEFTKRIAQSSYARYYSDTASRATTSTTSTTTISTPFADMNLVDLKILLKKLGGSPGTLRKADILALCLKLSGRENETVIIENISAASGESKKLDDIVRISSQEKTLKSAAKKTVRALQPILAGPQSIEQFQLPVIKGDINSIGSNIVQDLGKICSEKSKFGTGDYDNVDADYITPTTASAAVIKKEANGRDGKIVGNTSKIKSSNKNSTKPIIATATSPVTELVKSPSIREYTMGLTHNASGSTEVRDIVTGQHYWSNHPTGAFRDDRLLEGSQPILGITAGGPGSGMGDMDLTFLGTASCIPSLTRGVSCLAYRYKSDVWLFDCGEGSQQQMQKSRIKPSKINKIFITHLHGDHSFGLPGVLCLIGQSTMAEREKEKSIKKDSSNNYSDRFDNSKFDDDFVMDIYGPEGTRDFLRAAIQLTYSKVVNPYRIHELKNVPDLYHKYSKFKQALPQVRLFLFPFYI